MSLMQSNPYLKADIQTQQLQYLLNKRFMGIQTQINHTLQVQDGYHSLPYEYVGSINDQDNELIKQFRFSYVKWFAKNNCFALGYNKQKQGYFSVFEIHEWKLRYTKFSHEETMVALQKQDHLNRILGFGSNGGIYTIASGQEKQRSEPIAVTGIEQTTDVSYSSTFDSFAISSSNKSIYITPQERLKDYEQIRGHGKEVTTIDWNPVYNIILSGSEDETIRIWDANTKMEITNPLKRHNLGIKKVISSSDGQYFLSSGKDRCVNIFDLRQYETEICKINLQEQCDGLVWHPTYPNVFVTGDRFGIINYWNINTPQNAILQIKKLDIDTQINDLGIDNSGQFLACIRSIANEKDSREIFKRGNLTK